MCKCDIENCKNKVYKEVYWKGEPNKYGGTTHWSYMCRKHFNEEKNKEHIYGWCGV